MVHSARLQNLWGKEYPLGRGLVGMLLDLSPLTGAVGSHLGKRERAGPPLCSPQPQLPNSQTPGLRQSAPLQHTRQQGLLLGSPSPVIYFSTPHFFFFGSLFLFFIPQWIDWWVSRIPEKGVSHHLLDCFSTQEHENLASH